MFALFIHIYNRDSWEKILKDRIRNLQGYSPRILINLSRPGAARSKLISMIKQDFPEAFIISTPNKGRDIGGKLALIDFFIRAKLQTEYIVFLHDKQSDYWFAGEAWRQSLFAIVEPEKVKVILERFAQNPAIGVIGTSDLLRNEYDKKTNEFKTTNNKQLKELIAKYNLKVSDHRFVAGTMFWIRSSIIQKFFSQHSPLSCRELLEEGNFTDRYEGTYTHSWERLFCWLANDQGYNITGI